MRGVNDQFGNIALLYSYKQTYDGDPMTGILAPGTGTDLNTDIMYTLGAEHARSESSAGGLDRGRRTRSKAQSAP